PKTTYILQVRSFENPDEADQKRAEVMMVGVDAKVVKRDINGTTLYQVVSTPLASKDELMMAYDRLQMSGIDAVVLEQTH
ncbi:MAG: SPOR domain-containing protein, partial [Moraxella sp.]|nr:SPOR domain-containing protein [Moraxella sp.]